MTRSRIVWSTGLGLLVAAAGAAMLVGDRGQSRAETAPTVADATSVAAAPSRPPLRVRAVTVRRGTIERGGAVDGVVNAFRKSTVSAEAAGRVLTREVEPGDTVAAGAPLLTLDATRLALAVKEARANVAAREVDVAEAHQELERGEQLARGNTISESRMDSLRFDVDRAKTQLELARVNLATAQRALDDASIEAPFDGSVEDMMADVGDYLSPGAPIAVLVDLSRARVRAGVTAAEARSLEEDVDVTVVFEDLGASEMRGTIRSVGRLADPATGTYTVEIWVDDPAGDLRDGMVASVLLPQATRDPQPVVPRAALIRRQGLISLFVIEDGIAHARNVRVGRSKSELVEILEGVEVGDSVVVDGLFALRDGAPVSVEAASAEP